MDDLYDKNGNAIETHTVTVSGFDSVTGELINTYDVRIFAGTGIPGSSTLILAPAADNGYTVCWDGAAWQHVIDLRGSVAYEKSTGAEVRVKPLGPLAATLTALAPTTCYDTWDGGKWVTDAAAAQKAAIEEAELKRATLLKAASIEIAWRQDAVDAEMATDTERTELTAWKKYRVLLMRVDITAPEWPSLPSQA